MVILCIVQPQVEFCAYTISLQAILYLFLYTKRLQIHTLYSPTNIVFLSLCSVAPCEQSSHNCLEQIKVTMVFSHMIILLLIKRSTTAHHEVHTTLICINCPGNLQRWRKRNAIIEFGYRRFRNDFITTLNVRYGGRKIDNCL